MKASRTTGFLLWSVTLIGLALVGALTLFTRFMPYDDEGYVLWSVHSHLDGHALYDSVYTQYGPFFFLLYRILHMATGLVPDSESGRIIALTYWVSAAGLAGACAYTLTRSRLWSVAACGLSFVTLTMSANEPFHPGSLLTVLVGLFAWLTARAITEGKETSSLALACAVAAAAALIKINVGALLLIALGFWMLVHGAGRARLSPAARGVVMAGVCLLPLLLMHSMLGNDQFRRFAFVATGSFLGLAWMINRHPKETFAPRAWLLALLGAGGCTLGVVLFFVVDGTSFHGIVEGVLLAPLRHPKVYFYAPEFPLSSLALLVACLALIPLRVRIEKRRKLLGCLRVAAGVWIAWIFLTFPTGFPPDRFAFYFGPALAILSVFDPSSATPEPKARAALWLAWVGALQSLHAFPVAGSQVAWGIFLWSPLAVYGIQRGLADLEWRPRLLPNAPQIAFAGLAAFSVMRLGELSAYWWQTGVKPGFAGADRLCLRSDLAEDITTVEHNLVGRADMVFSLPGMFSFNLWTGIPAPTNANVTHWFSLLDHPHQDAIRDALAAAHRPAVVVMPTHLDYLYSRKFPVEGPLVDYLKSNFVPAIDAGTYEIWQRPGELVPGINSFTIQTNGVEVITDRLPAPVSSACLLPPRSFEDLLSPFSSLTRLAEMRPTPEMPWSSAAIPNQPGLERHILLFAPLQTRLPPGRPRLALLDAEGRVLAICTFDRLRQRLIDAAPPKSD